MRPMILQTRLRAGGEPITHGWIRPGLYPSHRQMHLDLFVHAFTKTCSFHFFFMHPPPPQHQGLTSTQVGEFAENFVHNRHFALLRSKLGNVLQHTDHIRVGSCCSGWGCLEMVLEELEPHWNDAHEGWQLKARLLEIILTPGLLNGISR